MLTKITVLQCNVARISKPSQLIKPYGNVFRKYNIKTFQEELLVFALNCGCFAYNH